MNLLSIDNLFLTRVLRMFNGKIIVFNKWYWDNWTGTFKKLNLDTQLILYTKIIQNDQRHKLRIKNIKLTVKNGVNLHGLCFVNDFLKMIP